jgi:hypothetical protein
LAPASIAITGDYRNWRLPVFQQLPTQTVALSTGAVAADAFLPIVPASKHHKGNTLSVSGEFVYGGGIADMYTGLTGGMTQPTIVNELGINGAGGYPGYVDNGTVIFDFAPGPMSATCPDGKGLPGATSCHDLHAIIWMTGNVGVQYYFPGGHVWLAANYAHVESPNIGDFTQTNAPNAQTSAYAQAATVIKSIDWVSGNLFIEPHPSVRIGLEYAAFIDRYVDNVQATNHRGQLSGWFLF